MIEGTIFSYEIKANQKIIGLRHTDNEYRLLDLNIYFY